MKEKKMEVANLAFYTIYSDLESTHPCPSYPLNQLESYRPITHSMRMATNLTCK